MRGKDSSSSLAYAGGDHDTSSSSDRSSQASSSQSGRDSHERTSRRGRVAGNTAEPVGKTVASRSRYLSPPVGVGRFLSRGFVADKVPAHLTSMKPAGERDGNDSSGSIPDHVLDHFSQPTAIEAAIETASEEGDSFVGLQDGTVSGHVSPATVNPLLADQTESVFSDIPSQYLFEDELRGCPTWFQPHAVRICRAAVARNSVQLRKEQLGNGSHAFGDKNDRHAMSGGGTARSWSGDTSRTSVSSSIGSSTIAFSDILEDQGDTIVAKGNDSPSSPSFSSANGGSREWFQKSVIKNPGKHAANHAAVHEYNYPGKDSASDKILLGDHFASNASTISPMIMATTGPVAGDQYAPTAALSLGDQYALMEHDVRAAFSSNQCTSTYQFEHELRGFPHWQFMKKFGFSGKTESPGGMSQTTPTVDGDDDSNSSVEAASCGSFETARQDHQDDSTTSVSDRKRSVFHKSCVSGETVLHPDERLLGSTKDPAGGYVDPDRAKLSGVERLSAANLACRFRDRASQDEWTCVPFADPIASQEEPRPLSAATLDSSECFSAVSRQTSSSRQSSGDGQSYDPFCRDSLFQLQAVQDMAAVNCVATHSDTDDCFHSPSSTFTSCEDNYTTSAGTGCGRDGAAAIHSSSDSTYGPYYSSCEDSISSGSKSHLGRLSSDEKASRWSTSSEIYKKMEHDLRSAFSQSPSTSHYTFEDELRGYPHWLFGRKFGKSFTAVDGPGPVATVDSTGTGGTNYRTGSTVLDTLTEMNTSANSGTASHGTHPLRSLHSPARCHSPRRDVLVGTMPRPNANGAFYPAVHVRAFSTSSPSAVRSILKSGFSHPDEDHSRFSIMRANLKKHVAWAPTEPEIFQYCNAGSETQVRQYYEDVVTATTGPSHDKPTTTGKPGRARRNAITFAGLGKSKTFGSGRI